MKLHKLTLHNLGPFYGEHVFDLNANDNNNPITLIGALNGSGKTTFLEALLLSLYGKRSPSSRRIKSSSYDSYIKKLINRDVTFVDGASLVLDFSMTTDGKEANYNVKRSWVASNSNSKKVKEYLEVYVDDVKDDLLTKEWSNFIELILPIKLSELFFFDGEQIESLADPETSNEFLSSAIDELLGIGTIKQLSLDLNTLVTKNDKSIIEKNLKDSDSKDHETTSALVKKIEELNLSIEKVGIELAENRDNKKRNQNELEKVQLKLEKNGGRLWEQRADLESEKRGKTRDLIHLKEQTNQLASGALPFIFVLPFLKNLKEQIKSDESIVANLRFNEEINKYEDKLLLDIKSLELNSLDSIRSIIDANKSNRNARSMSEALFKLTLNSDDRLVTDLESLTYDCARDYETLKEKYILISHRIEFIDQELARIPEGNEISTLLQNELKLKNEISVYSDKLLVLQESLDEKKIAFSKCQEEYKIHLSKQAEKLQETDESSRIKNHVNRVNTTLKQFQKKIHKYHLRGLERNILESMNLLMRKSSLISDIKINEEDFRIQVFNSKEQLVPPDRLSSGERQLLAVATLWGLAKSTGLNLPVVIDTPLSRLDSSHRTEIVMKYFPSAADQVIILSTDEEIDEKYYPLLKDSISNEYLIEFDENTETSRIVEGYWFNQKELSIAN